MSTPTIVILGGTGFVGRHLAAVLTGRGYRIIVPSRNRNRRREVSVLPAVDVVDCNVYDGAELARLFQGSEAVINLIGILNESGRDGGGFRRAHVELTATVIKACNEAGVKRLLQMSALNAGRGDSHYLRSRGEAERLVRESHLKWTIFQPSVMFGSGDGLFFRFAALLRMTPVLPLACSGARFAPVYVGDVARAMAAALSNPDSTGRCYPLVGPETLTLGEIVRRTIDWLGVRRLVLPLPGLASRLQAAVFDFVPGKPFSSDNYRSLQLDSVSNEDGLAALGVCRTAMQKVMPDLLGRSPRQQRLDANRLVR